MKLGALILMLTLAGCFQHGDKDYWNKVTTVVKELNKNTIRP